ncbi:PIGO family protein [Megaselia abdita]
MKYACYYLFVLLWLAILISSGIFLFSRGFLLSRVSKTEVANCLHFSNSSLNESSVAEIFKDVNSSSNLCFPKKSKVVILVIDALKYDFGVYDENLVDPKPYQNKLRVIHELLELKPNRSRLLKFIADPPTTTLQRLKGLTTGSLPTFIDIGSNFASPEINEDNIIDQIIRHNLSMVFLGDSTWTDLYPNRFKRSYSYPSFDIFDLDTVDNKIKGNLPRELAKNDWDVLIAHFLGVDHCGHRYGPTHKEMERKLLEMDDVIRNVINQMDDDTTLLVIGDHGMTITGDHGGESSDEINALLFAHMKSKSFISDDYGSDKEAMQQIDLVPTLSTILGVPIPYSNLGLINYNVVPDISLPFMLQYQTLLIHSWHNAKQIFNYFYTYAMDNKRTFKLQDLNDMENKFIQLTHRANTIYNGDAFKSFVGDLNIELRGVLQTCRNVWVKFDPNQMKDGLLATFLPIFFMFLLIVNSKSKSFYQIFTGKVIFHIYALSIVSAGFGYRYHQMLYIELKSEVHGAIFCLMIVSTLILSYLVITNWENIAINWHESQKFQNIPTRLILIFAMGVFFSNSYIIEEQKILCYLLMGVIGILVLDIIKHCFRFDKKNKLKISSLFKSLSFKLALAGGMAIVLLRSSYNLFRCREEQTNCGDFQTSGNTVFRKGGRGNIYLLSVGATCLYTLSTRIYLKTCGNLTGHSLNVSFARYGPILAAICTSGHILLSNNSDIKIIKPSHVDALALVIYALFLLQVLILIISPLMVFVLPRINKQKQQLSVNSRENVVLELFKKIKNSYDETVEIGNGDEHIPVVYGLATVYSSIIISFGLFLTLLLITIQDPKSSVGIVICLAVAAITLVIHSILRFKTSSDFESSVQPKLAAIVGWFLLSHFCFFATSHQTTLSQIDWRAAFVGRTSNYDNSNVISGFLVIINTFAGQILFMVLYGLLSSHMFSIFALFPDLSKTKALKDKTNIRQTTIKKGILDSSNEFNIPFDVTRGELVIYEYESVFLGSVFKLAAQFMLLHGLRVSLNV